MKYMKQESWIPIGISDLNGNLWDVLSGLRLMDGEIHIIPDNDSAAGVDESECSPNWRAIKPDGSLAPPNSEGTFKLDGVPPGRDDDLFTCLPGGVKLSTQVLNPLYKGGEPDTIHRAYTISRFNDMTHEDATIPHRILKQIGIFPVGEGSGNPIFFVRNYGERVPYRGGSWFDGPGAGLWELYMRENRTWIAEDCGFRSAYVDKEYL